MKQDLSIILTNNLEQQDKFHSLIISNNISQQKNNENPLSKKTSSNIFSESITNTPTLWGSGSSSFISFLNFAEKKIMKFIPFLYNTSTILSNSPMDHNSLDAFEKELIHYEKQHGFNVDPPMNVSVLLTERTKTLQTKSQKEFKTNIFKIISITNKYFLYIGDCYLGLSLEIELELLKEPPCKSLAFDPIKNYVFLYDNKDSIYVLTAKITDQWSLTKTMAPRIIGVLKLNNKRISPVLYCYNTINGAILLVAGGYNEIKKEVFQPLQSISVFSCNFSDFNNTSNLKIHLRYPRAEPVLCHLKYESPEDNKIYKKLYIIGGTNDAVLKKLKPPLNEKKFLLEGNCFAETINLEDIEDSLYKNKVMNQMSSLSLAEGLVEIHTNKTYQLLGDETFLNKKIYTIARAAMLKIHNKASSSKCMVIIGLGKKKQKVFEIHYIDHKGQKLFIKYRTKLNFEGKFIGNHMVCLKNNLLCYWGEQKNGIFYRADVGNNDKIYTNCKLKCVLF